MNNVQLIGRLTKDVDMRYVNGAQGQTDVARFTVAVDRPPKADGTKETDFISCQAWGRKAEVIQQYFQKGSKIGLIGKIRTGSYQNQQGATVYTTYVEVTDIDFLDPKSTQQPNPTTPEYNMQQGQNYYQAQAQQAPVPQQPKRKPATKAPTNVKPQQARAPQARQQSVADQGGWMDLPDGADPVVDEGLPF